MKTSIVKVLVAAAVNEIKLLSQASAPILHGCLMSSPGLETKHGIREGPELRIKFSCHNQVITYIEEHSETIEE